MSEQQTSETAELSVWEYVEAAPVYVTATADLWHWSTNYDPGKGPITMFLDLIGWSEDEIGEPLYSFENGTFGYLELAKLAAALTEYVARPEDVRAWIDTLCQYEDS